MANNACRIAGDDGELGNVLGHNGTGADDRASSDMYTRQDDGSSTNPHIVGNHDRLTITEPLLNHRQICSGRTMVAREDHHLRPHHDV